MKRAADSSFPLTQLPAFPIPGPGGPARQQHPGPGTSGAPNPENRPVVASITDRMSAALRPAQALQHPAAGSATYTARQVQPKPSAFTDDYQRQVFTKINEGAVPWAQTVKSISTTEERKVFVAASLAYIAIQRGGAGAWNAEVEKAISGLGMDFLLQYKWPSNITLAHILGCIKNSNWLQLALATEGGKKSLLVRDPLGRVPLHWAAHFGRKKTVQVILAHDDDTGSIGKIQAKDGRSALHVAIANMNNSVAMVLLNYDGGEQRLVPDKLGELPIHLALQRGGDIEVLACLLAKRATEQALAQTKAGSNALLIAAHEGPVAIVDMLLAIPGTAAAQLEAGDSKGRRAIEYARHGGKHEVIARIEAAMQTVSATSTSASTASLPSSVNEASAPPMPVPVAAAPASDADFSETEEDLADSH